MAETGEQFGDDLIEGIYQGEITPALEARSRSRFKPWHKPRKHYIRLEQWCRETRQLLKKINAVEGGELRYLGLPGEDLLDIRVLKGVCQRSKVVLRYLGFDSALNSPQLNLSRHEVNSDQFIHPSSVIIADRLEDLGSPDTVAFQYVERHAPFDVINLDLCDSVTSVATQGTIPNLEAIRTLCDVQLRRRGQPWLLFLTTRAVRSELDAETRAKLFEQLLKNVAAAGPFSDALRKKLGLDEAALREELAADGGTLTADAWLSVYILSIAKWLLHYMAGHHYSVSVRLMPSYVYSVQHGRRDMISLGFLLEPPVAARSDDSGLTKPRNQGTAAVQPTEQDLARGMIDSVATVEDVDAKLAADRALLIKMFKKSAALLATLHYDMSKYKAFALGE